MSSFVLIRVIVGRLLSIRVVESQCRSCGELDISGWGGDYGSVHHETEADGEKGKEA
jgi:hypothetical protein